MILFRYALILTMIVAQSEAIAQENANLQTSLGKLSRALRGIPPTSQEKTEMSRALGKGEGEQYYAKKISEYVSDKKFEVLLKYRLDELFRVRTDDGSPAEQGNTSSFVDSNTALDNIFRDVIHLNEPWDNILLRKKYRFIDSSKYDGYGTYKDGLQFDAMGKVNQELLKPDDYLKYQLTAPSLAQREVSFSEDDIRISGALTTEKFLVRYGNTALNKNRRRAAAVFRIFLCDSMVAAVPPQSNDSVDRDYETIFPGGSKVMGKSEEELRAEIKQGDPHGTQKDCMSCHYKLDPMGKTFGLSAVGINPIASPGALSFKNSKGQYVNESVAGIGELGLKITQQPEYLSCQVRHFWNWFIGKDAPLTKDRQKELIKKFVELQRRPKDFISYLVSSREFRAKPEILTESQILARRAARILKNCTDCHSNLGKGSEIEYIDLTDLPYGLPEYMIGQLSWVLDVKGDGSKRIMPPKESLWQLSPEEEQVLRTWIKSGAPDYSGKRQVP